MKNVGTFYAPEEVRAQYGEIIPAYQSAFAGEPWNEVSKCVDERQRCAGGLSPVAVGALCFTCEKRPELPAYDEDELSAYFDRVGEMRSAIWYIEREQGGIAMAALAWRATPGAIAEAKYLGQPAMRQWLKSSLVANQRSLSEIKAPSNRQAEVVWLDEVFANKQIRSEGNLRNFGYMLCGMADRLGSATIAYRTIEPRMIRAARRDFSTDARIYEREAAVLDRRDFVVVRPSVSKVTGYMSF